MEKYFNNNLILQNKSSLQDASVAPIKNGRYIVVEETRELYYDTNNKRTKLRDVQILETEADRTSLTSMLNNDMFYVIESNLIYFYTNGQWITCNNEVYIGPDEPTDPSVKIWINTDALDSVLKIVDSLDSTSTSDALSANQGRVLNEKIVAIEERLLVARI